MTGWIKKEQDGLQCIKHKWQYGQCDSLFNEEKKKYKKTKPVAKKLSKDFPIKG